MSTSDDAAQIPVTRDTGFRSVTNGSGGTSSGNGGSNNRGHGGATRLQRILTDVSNAEREFKGSVEELGVLGTTLERYLKHSRPFDKFIVGVSNYSGRNYDYGADMKPAIIDLVDPMDELMKKMPLKPKKQTAKIGIISNAVTLEPDDLERHTELLRHEQMIEQETMDAIYEAELEVWKSDIKNFSSRKNLLASNMTKLYSLIIGQCTSAMICNAKKEKEYAVKSRECDALWLLKVLKKLCSGINSSHNVYLTAVRKIRDYVNCIQKESESSASYAERLTSARRAMELACGPILRHVELEAQASPDEIEEGMAAAFTLLNADKARHAERIKEMEKAVELGDDRIPTEEHKALEILVSNEERLRGEQLRFVRSSRGGRNGLNLYQSAAQGNGSGGNGVRRSWPDGVIKSSRGGRNFDDHSVPSM